MNREQLLRESEALAERQAHLDAKKKITGGFLDGEDPSSPFAEDAIHWAEVYGELAMFKRELLDELKKSMQAASTREAPTELEHDRQLLTVELQRLELHHTFWQERIRSSAG